MSQAHRVVVGAGFGGLFATRRLRSAPVEATLIDRTTHQPLPAAALSVGDRHSLRKGRRASGAGRFAKSPCCGETSISTVGILLTSLTFLLIDEYAIVAFIGFTLYGVGRGFYATPSTDAAMSSVPSDKAGAAAGIYKTASTLGSAVGVAFSYAVNTAGEHIPANLVPHIFWGRQDNVSMRFGGGVGLLFNVLICVIALVSIMVAVPEAQPEKERIAKPQGPPSPALGS